MPSKLWQLRHSRESLAALQFQATAEEGDPQAHEAAENDPPAAEPVEDGSNVVSVDFSRKK